MLQIKEKKDYAALYFECTAMLETSAQRAKLQAVHLNVCNRYHQFDKTRGIEGILPHSEVSEQQLVLASRPFRQLISPASLLTIPR